jgi:hypothetical protein
MKKVAKKKKSSRKDPNRKINTGVRFQYTVAFAKAMRKRNDQSGMATRKEIKAWAAKRLDRAMAKVMELVQPEGAEE